MTNYEVLAHLQSLRARYAAQDAENQQRYEEEVARRRCATEPQGEEFNAKDPKREMRAPNLETIMKEVRFVLDVVSSKLHDNSVAWNADTK